MTWLLWLGLVLCLPGFAVVALVAGGARRWNTTTQALTRRLDAANIDVQAQPPSPSRYDSREIARSR